MPSTTPQRSTTRRILGALPSLLAVVLLVLAGRWFAARWEGVAGFADRPPIHWRWLVVAFAVLLVHAASAMTIWRQLLAAVGARLTWRQAADTFAPSLLARYVPGKIWANAARLALTRRAGVALGASTGAILWETMVALGTGSIVATAGLSRPAALPADTPFSVGAAPFQAAAGLLAAMVAAYAITWLVAQTGAGKRLIEKVGGTGPLERPASLLPAIGTGIGGWALYGLAHLAIANAVGPVAFTDLPLLTGAVALAWTAGYLAFVMPVGLGVRDALLVVLLAPLLSAEASLLFVALSRLVQLAVDTSITLGWLTVRGVSLRAGPRPASPPSA